ncbi:MAG: cell envelope integrity protein TolA [Chromatiales bacterium]|nr:cell envelope integrity protein TolA [Chromatiales bacterium]
MLEFVRDHARPLAYSVLVHLVIVVGLVLNVTRFSQPAAAPMKVVPVVQSSVVDMSEVNRQVKERAIAEQRERDRKAQVEKEKARQIEIKKKRDQELREAKLKADAEKKKEAELQVKAAREKAEADKKAEAERKRKQEQDRKAKLEAEKKAEELRKKKEAEELRRKQIEAKQRAEAEAQLREQMAAEEARNAAERSGLLAQYIALIGQKIERNWIRPPSAKPGLECVVQVTQIPGGQVVSVKVVRCNGDDAVIRSVEAAVYQASPLPDPADPSLFERRLQLIFRPED